MAVRFDIKGRYIFARFDPTTNVLYSGCHAPQMFREPSAMRELSDELVAVIRRCRTKPALFVDFANVRFDPALSDAYREMLARIRPLLSDIYRYNVSHDVTGTLTRSFIRTSSVASRGSANLFADEESALKTYLAARKAANDKA